MPNNEPKAVDNPGTMSLGEPEMGEPQDMTQDFGGDMGEMPVDNENGESDSEIDSIFSKLDTEKQAAVIKYAKSMIDDSAVEDPQNESAEMPGEDEIVTEIVNNVLDDRKKEPESDEDKKVRNKKVTISNPFMTKDFNNS